MGDDDIEVRLERWLGHAKHVSGTTIEFSQIDAEAKCLLAPLQD